MRNNRRNTSVKFTLTCTTGNTIVKSVPLGSIGEWIGRLGGDDLCVEELIYFKEADYNGVKFTINQERSGNETL